MPSTQNTVLMEEFKMTMGVQNYRILNTLHQQAETRAEAEQEEARIRLKKQSDAIKQMVMSPEADCAGMRMTKTTAHRVRPTSGQGGQVPQLEGELNGALAGVQNVASGLERCYGGIYDQGSNITKH